MSHITDEKRLSLVAGFPIASIAFAKSSEFPWLLSLLFVAILLFWQEVPVIGRH